MLLLIDDADDVTQIKSLLPPCELHPESLVIVTSRKKKILEARCTLVSEVQLLPEGRDMQLFEAWAFAESPPCLGRVKAGSTEVVACCGQLPLTLKVGHCSMHAYLLQADMRDSCLVRLCKHTKARLIQDSILQIGRVDVAK